MLSSGDIVLCADARIMAEYADVLHRPKFQLNQAKVEMFLSFIRDRAEVCAGNPLPEKLPHLDDEAFLEVAIAGHVECLVTGNTAHFPMERCAHIKVVTPRQFLELWKKRRTTPST